MSSGEANWGDHSLSKRADLQGNTKCFNFLPLLLLQLYTHSLQCSAFHQKISHQCHWTRIWLFTIAHIPISCLSHSLKCVSVCVCVAAPVGQPWPRSQGQRERQPIRDVPLPVSSPNGERSPAVRPGMSEELHKSFSWYFNSSVFTQAASHLHEVKFSAANVRSSGWEQRHFSPNGKWKLRVARLVNLKRENLTFNVIHLAICVREQGSWIKSLRFYSLVDMNSRKWRIQSWERSDSFIFRDKEHCFGRRRRSANASWSDSTNIWTIFHNSYFRVKYQIFCLFGFERWKKNSG